MFELEDKRKERMKDLATLIQKVYRGWTQWRKVREERIEGGREGGRDGEGRGMRRGEGRGGSEGGRAEGRKGWMDG